MRLDGPGGATWCSVVRQDVLSRVAGEAGMAARAEGFNAYLDRRTHAPESLAAAQWACKAAGLCTNALDGPLAAEVRAVLRLFDLVLLQRMGEAPCLPAGGAPTRTEEVITDEGDSWVQGARTCMAEGASGGGWKSGTASTLRACCHSARNRIHERACALARKTACGRIEIVSRCGIERGSRACRDGCRARDDNIRG